MKSAIAFRCEDSLTVSVSPVDTEADCVAVIVVEGHRPAGGKDKIEDCGRFLQILRYFISSGFP